MSVELKMNSKQELALSLPTRRLFLTGGVRAGKSLVAAVKIREIALRMPGSQILIMRSTLKEIRDDVFKTLYNPLDGLLANERIYGKLNKSNYEHNLPNGSKIMYRQADDAKKLLGLDLSVIYFEQAENIRKEIFDFALTRLTFWGDNKNPQSRGYRYIQKYKGGEYADSIVKKPSHFFILSSNPDTGSWLYDDIISTCPNFTPFTPHIHHPELGWDIINFQTTDNVQLPNVKSYIDEIKLTSSTTHYRRLILGEWCGNDGLIYSHFVNQFHIINEYTPKEQDEIIVGIDPGSSHYTAVIFGSYNKKTSVYTVFDELKTKEVTIPEISTKIKEILTGYKIDINKVTFLIDAAGNQKESNGISKADQYKQNKIYVINANKILDGALERINGLFKGNKIKITGNCVNLLNDLKSYKYDKHGKPDKGVGERAWDCADAFRYFVNHFAYGLPHSEPPEVITDPSKRQGLELTRQFQEATQVKQTDSYWGL